MRINQMKKSFPHNEYQALKKAIRLEEQFFKATEQAAKSANCHPEKICPGFINRLNAHSQALIDLYNLYVANN